VKVYGIFRRGVLIYVPATGKEVTDIGYVLYARGADAQAHLEKIPRGKRDQFVIEEIEVIGSDEVLGMDHIEGKEPHFVQTRRWQLGDPLASDRMGD
jgi:hypothetical protein